MYDIKMFVKPNPDTHKEGMMAEEILNYTDFDTLNKSVKIPIYIGYESILRI